MKLRPLKHGDADQLAMWLPETAADLGCEQWADAAALDRTAAGSRVLVTEDLTALVAHSQAKPKRKAVCVEFLAVAPRSRRLGIGGRVALALERRLRHVAPHVYVPIPATLGLALYFWLRLGYRPLTQNVSPAELNGLHAVWMVRDLA